MSARSADLVTGATGFLGAALVVELLAQSSRDVLCVVRELDARHYVHFSTAYVAGRRTGTILERPVVDSTDMNNPYEESKARAELLVADATGLRTWIMRPAVVIGHSETHATLSDQALYA